MTRKNTATVATANTAAAVTTDAWTFTPTTITLLGRTLPANYAIAKDGTVYVRTGAEGTPIRLSFRSGDPRYHAAFEAAGLAKQAAKPAAKDAAQPAKQAAKPAAKDAAQPAKQAAKPAAKAAAQPAKQAAKPAAKAAQPAKQAAKPAAKLPAFRFVEDEALQRLRLVFDGEPAASQQAAVAAAGFYWSNATKSFHKRLTPKAKRAAAALTETLNALTK